MPLEHKIILRDITLGDVTAFVLVAQMGSFALAAEELLITQSALSRRIKKLEDSLGGTLLDRTTRSVSVSTLGKEFLPSAIRIVDDFHRSLDDIDKTLALEPRHFGALSGRGLVYINLEEWEPALQAFDDALDVYPQMVGPRVNAEAIRLMLEGRPI